MKAGNGPRGAWAGGAAPGARAGQHAIELVATDLDGTLWDRTERVHPAVQAAIARLAVAGVPLLVATGRRYRTAHRVLQHHGLLLPGVFLDGSVVMDAEKQLVSRASFAQETASSVLDAFDACGVVPLLVVDRPGPDLFLPGAYSGSPVHLQRNVNWVEDRVPEQVLRGTDPLLAFSVTGGEPARLRAVADALAGVASVSLTDDRIYGGATLQVRPAGISKWTGVRAYCEHRGIDPGRVLAVGDASNDVELLAGAAVACAMDDAPPEVLALADHLIPAAATGGWAAVADIALA